MRILVLGITGMLGHAVFSGLSEIPGNTVIGTVRGHPQLDFLPRELRNNVVSDLDAGDHGEISQIILNKEPRIIINCVGVVKQNIESTLVTDTIGLNALFPHKLLQLADSVGARLIHISTDCVFSGMRGNYREDDFADATDLYGRSKYLGEVAAPNAITLRTSIIGPEINRRHGLLEWFLSQRGHVNGFAKAIFSGLSTDELTRVISRYVLPRPDLHGVHHVSGAAISKHDLLCLFRDAYDLPIAIQRNDELIIDRSLDSSRFRQATGYVPPEWEDMVRRMRQRHGAWRQARGSGVPE